MCCEDFTKENSRKSQMKPLKHIYLGIYNWTPIILTEMIEKHYFVIDMTCNKFKRTRCKTKYKNGIQNKKPCKRKVITLWSYLIFFSLLPCLFSIHFEPTSSASKIFKTILVIILSCSPHLPTPKKNRIWMPGMAVQLQILPTLYMFLSLSLSNSNLQHNVFEQKPRNQRVKVAFWAVTYLSSYSGYKGNVSRLLLFKKRCLLLLHTSTNKTIVSICSFLSKWFLFILHNINSLITFSHQLNVFPWLVIIIFNKKNHEVQFLSSKLLVSSYLKTKLT